jgi:hypothetical protein
MLSLKGDLEGAERNVLTSLHTSMKNVVGPIAGGQTLGRPVVYLPLSKLTLGSTWFNQLVTCRILHW